MKKKPSKTYMTNRKVYKDVKGYDHAKFDAFCTNIYAEGFKDGEKSIKGVDVQDVMKAIGTVKGIGEKRMKQIEDAMQKLYSREDCNPSEKQ